MSVGFHGRPLPQDLQRKTGLTRAQIHAALAYYCDHQAELDAEIKRRWREVNERAAQQGESPLPKRLRMAGKRS